MPTYSISAGIFAGPIDFIHYHACYVATDYPYYTLMTTSSLSAAYAYAGGACRTAPGYTINATASALSPAACEAACSNATACVGYEISSSPGLEDEACWMHFENIVFAQYSGVYSGDYDIADYHDCIKKDA